MQFNSYIFIMVFLPAIVILYFFFNKINAFMGKMVLILGSILFYGYSDWKMLTVLGISIAVNYLFAMLIEHRGGGVEKHLSCRSSHC